MATFLALLADFLTSGTFRRAAAAIVGVALPWLNQKLGLNIDGTQVVSAMALLAGYIAQSVTNEMHARSSGDVAAGINAEMKK